MNQMLPEDFNVASQQRGIKASVQKTIGLQLPLQQRSKIHTPSLIGNNNEETSSKARLNYCFKPTLLQIEGLSNTLKFDHRKNSIKLHRLLEMQNSFLPKHKRCSNCSDMWGLNRNLSWRRANSTLNNMSSLCRIGSVQATAIRSSVDKAGNHQTNTLMDMFTFSLYLYTEAFVQGVAQMRQNTSWMLRAAP